MKKFCIWLLCITLVITNIAMIYFNIAVRYVLKYVSDNRIDEQKQFRDINQLQEDINEIHNRK